MHASTSWAIFLCKKTRDLLFDERMGPCGASSPQDAYLGKHRQQCSKQSKLLSTCSMSNPPPNVPGLKAYYGILEHYHSHLNHGHYCSSTAYLTFYDTDLYRLPILCRRCHFNDTSWSERVVLVYFLASGICPDGEDASNCVGAPAPACS